jgi:predicted ATPase
MCSASTERLLKGAFESKKVGLRSFPEISQAVELFALDGLRHTASVTDPAPSPLTPLTGRDQELSLLVERWEQAREGMGQIVLLVGESGLGKSRLVDTLKVRVQGDLHGDENAPIVEWRCSPLYQNSSLYPAIDFYERFLEFDALVSPQDRFERLLRHLQRYDLARPDVVPLFVSLLSLPHDERFPWLGLSPIREKEETFRVLRECLRAYSSTQPALFIVEDLHWMDPSTLEFLSQFVAEDVQDGMLTLLTFRPEFKTPWPAVSHQTGLALNRLTRRQVGDMMRQTTGGQRLPDALINEVYDRTSGVPLFVEEFTKMAEESGLLTEVSDDSGRTRALIAREIPASLQDLVTARLDRMEGNRDVVHLAATIGREFSYDLMAAAAIVDEPTLQAELRKLADADILYQKGRPPRCGYVFKHALLEDAAYNSLVKSKRQEFHHRIADVLEVQFPQIVETQPEVLAHHFTDAGVTEKGIGYWLKAGLRSQGRSANVEAIAHLRQGLAMLTLLPVSRAREAMEIQFLNALGTAYISTRGYGASEVGPIFTRARALCQRVGEPRRLFAILWGSWAWSLVRGDVRGSLELAGEGMELAARVADPGMLMEALFLPAATEFFRGDFRAAHECSARALADYDDRDRIDVWRAHTGEDSGVAHRAYHALALWHLGFPDQAAAMSRETVALARDVGHQFTLAFALEHAAWLYQHCRLGAEALSCAEEEIAIAAAEGFAYWHASGTAFKAGAMLLQGRADDAVTALGGAMKALTSTGSEIGNPCRFSILGDAYTQCGQYQDAHEALDQGLAVVEKNDDRCYEAELHRLQGELWLAESPEHVKRAEECFRRAIDVSRRQGSRAWELRSVMSLARLWNGQQRADDARQALAAVYHTFDEGFTTPDLTEATLLMGKLA